MRAKNIALSLYTCACAAGCGRPSTQSTIERRAATAEISSAAAGAAAADASPSAPHAKDAAPWRGSYHSETGTIFVPPEWKGVHWSVPATSEGLGDGPMALEVTDSRVSGTLDGPLGPASIEGVVSGPNVTATVRRRDPADRGYAGTLIATIAGDGDGNAMTGTMKLSLGEVSAVRTATFSLSRAP
jgi:hypothetical protein